MELSTDRILGKVAEIAGGFLSKERGARFLDVGAGTGALIALIRQTHPHILVRACDHTTSLMALPGQTVETADLNEADLPYADGTFDVVTCTEVIEHVENYRRLVREIHRVTKPGGTAIFSTPNILNLHSRLRFLYFGFWRLFGPLPAGRAEKHLTAGHITPISYFYLAHALAESGFDLHRFDIDKVQRSAIPKLVIFWPFIAFFGFLARRRELHKYRTIDQTNRAWVTAMNSLKMLLGRTLIVVAVRPSA